MSNLDTQKRLARSLAMVGYLARVKTTSVDVLAEKFGGDPGSILKDLNVLTCCGLPPYSPLDLVEIIIEDDGTIKVEQTELLHKLDKISGLSFSQGVKLIMALELLGSVSPEEIDGISSLKEKLSNSLLMKSAFLSEVNPTELRDLIEIIKQVKENSERIEITYQSTTKDETTVRKIYPNKLFWNNGYCYLHAYCFKTGSLRQFRLDRIVSTGKKEKISPDDLKRINDVMKLVQDKESSTKVVIEIDSLMKWVLRYIRNYSVLNEDLNKITISTDLWGDAWLTRLVLIGGKHLKVTIAESHKSAIRDTIDTMLRNYQQIPTNL